MNLHLISPNSAKLKAYFLQRIKYFSLFICIVLFFAPVASVKALSPADQDSIRTINLSSHDGETAVGRSLYLLEDKDKNLTIEQIVEFEENHWTEPRVAVPSMGFSDSAFWLKIKITNPKLNRESLLLDISNSALDNVRVYFQRDKKIDNPIIMGDRFPFEQREIFHRHFVVPFDLEAGDSVLVYIRVTNLGSVQIPIFLRNERAYDLHEEGELLGWGVYFGILIIMSLYNVILFIALRETVYFYFSISILSNIIFQMALYGFGFQYIWPNFESINSWIIPVTNSLFYASSSAFIGEFIKVKRFSLIQYRLLNLSKYLALFLAVISPFIQYKYSVYIVTIAALPFSLLGVVISATALRSGFRSARFFLSSWIIYTSFTFILALNKMGIIPRNVFTEYGVEVGNVLSVLFMSIALADRINFERKHRIAADEEVLRIEKRERAARELYLQQDIDRKEQELITQQKIIIAREEVLLAQAQSKNKSGFLATMSHEIRTPLNGILGMLDLLHDTPLNKKQLQYLEVVESSGKSLLSIINDVLDFSKIEAGKIVIESRVFDIGSVCKEITQNFRHLAEEKSISVECTGFKEEPFLVKSDPNRIRQILLNLVSNSIKFTEKGSICLQFSVVDNKVTENGISPKIKLELSDSGIGISKEQQSKLFQMFSQADGSTTRKYGGTGLGLSISRRLVELMGGEIGVVSEQGKGATFWFTVQSDDISSEEVKKFEKLQLEATRESKLTKYENQFFGLKVLIAEDNLVNQIVIQNLVSKLGMAFDIVEDGQQAIDYVKSHHSELDLVLMDCEMPVVDGYDASREIRLWERKHKTNSIPIFALTAHFLDEHKEISSNAGMDAHISKPVSLKSLYEGIITNPCIVQKMAK